MKTLAILSIWLALPLAAQNVDAKASPEFKQSSLTSDEYGELALALLQFQSARITLLQNLAAKQAGSDDITLAEQMGQAFTKAQVELAKKHGACDGAQWNFASKVWVCPQK